MPWDGAFFRLDGPEELGKWSKEMRANTKVSCVDVSEAMDCARNQVSAWERGKLTPNLRTAIKLIQAHGCEVYIVRKGRIRGGQ